MSLISTFCRIFLSHSAEKLWLVNPSVLCFRKFPVAKKFMDKKEGVSRFSVENFLSHCTEIFHRRTLWCFRKILLLKIFMHRRGASRFCRNFLSHSTETKSFVKEPFCFPEIFWYWKKFMDKKGHITIFGRNFYVSQCRKLSLGNPTVFEKIWGIEKFYA